MVEMKIDKTTAYIGEQMLLTVKLVYSNELVDGQLAHPDVKGALFRQLEKQKEYSQTRSGKRFEVVERQYAVFAEKDGELTIPAVKFSGRFVNRRLGRGRYETVASQPVLVDIKAPPDEFDGRTWLPAMGFSISESYEPDGTQLKVGESVTRTITLQGLGLESATLPPISTKMPDGVRLYPGQTETDEEVHAAGVTGVRSQEYALVATKAGRFVLPEIRIAWWDVVNDEQRVAILPERVLQVTGTGVAVKDDQTPAVERSNEDLSEAPDLDDSVAAPRSPTEGSSWFWPLLSLLLALLSIGLAWLAWHYRQMVTSSPQIPITRSAGKTSAKRQWEERERAALAAMSPCSFASAYSSWLKKQSSRQDLAHDEQTLQQIRNELAMLQERCFGKYTSSDDGQATQLQSALLALTDRWLTQAPDATDKPASLAQSLYPQG